MEEMYTYDEIIDIREGLEDLDYQTYERISEYNQDIADKISEGLGMAISALMALEEILEEE